jgi:hypothetical protein
MKSRDKAIRITRGRLFHIPVKKIHHANFPEVSAEAKSSLASARLLLAKLAHVHEAAQTDRERAMVASAISDVEDFASRCGSVPMPMRRQSSQGGERPQTDSAASNPEKARENASGVGP